VLVRTRAGARELCNDRRSSGSTAVSEEGEADERDPLVSDHAEKGSARDARVGRVQAERAWAEQPGRPRSADVGRARAWAGLRAKIQAAYCAKLFFFFLFMQFLLDVRNYVINCVVIQK
jgi:hypothetical protein